MVSTRSTGLFESGDEVTRGDVDSARKPQNDCERRVPEAALDLRDVHEAHPGALGNIGLSQPLALSQHPQPRAEGAADPRVPVFGHARIVRTRSQRRRRGVGASALTPHPAMEEA
jgi:hypothetical protein